ncbi:MAG: hypothetical protein A2V79_05815 [Betaproteobacteria bacterium RBG_16_56_24]|nr:MAG: hypothetical protein A2V79_05815 [Betaproteobacteria bacterium RBG_16_56_24]
MSLLLDARKKAQQAQSAQGGDGVLSGTEAGQGAYQDSHPLDDPRSAGKNLFNAKYPASPLARTGINRNLLIALGGTVLLLTAGAGYVWYAVSAGNTQPLRPISSATVAPLSKPAPATTTAQTGPVPAIATPQAVTPGTLPAEQQTGQPAQASRSTARKPAPRPHKSSAMRIEQQSRPIDPLLNDAYLEYRSGKFEHAQQLYREALNLDARNSDALLGLAAIAQRRGSDNEAAHYYAQALALDPRNAVANAGMAALTADDNRESRLKNLLNEQQDSSSLHFALGNYYAGQERWGEAQQSYANAYRLEPGNAGLAFNLAVSLDRLGQKNPAAQHYRRAMQLDESHSAGFDHAQIEQRIQELTR